MRICLCPREKYQSDISVLYLGTSLDTDSFSEKRCFAVLKHLSYMLIEYQILIIFLHFVFIITY